MFEYIISKKWLNITHYNLPNSELNKYKSGIENGTEVTLKISSNIVGDSNEIL